MKCKFQVLLLAIPLMAGLYPVTAVASSSYISKIGTSFSGISDSSTYPPGNALCVGPSNIVMAEGAQIAWTNLTGGSPTQQSVYSFFSSLNPKGGLYDPRCAYDSANGRYVVTMISNVSSGSGNIITIDVAVSKDSNPNDSWYFAQLNTSLTINGQLTGPDRESLAVDGTNIYITAPQFNVNASGYVGTEVWVIGDSAGTGGGIYNGGALTVVANELTSSSQGSYYVGAGGNGKTYLIADWSNGQQVILGLQTYDVASKTFGSTATIGLGNIDQGQPYTAQQQGTSLLLNAGDMRESGGSQSTILILNGDLWGVAEARPIGSSVPFVHWFEIDVSNPSSPALVAQGNISGTAIGAGVATFNPSLAADTSGDIIINFTASGPNMYPADYYVFRGALDQPGFSTPVLYQAGSGYFNSGNGSSVQPWGYNSSAIVDPNNSNSFWISNEYVANGWWQTSVAQVCIGALLPVSCPPAPVASGSGSGSGSSGSGSGGGGGGLLGGVGGLLGGLGL
jgi:hypothetical protein